MGVLDPGRTEDDSRLVTVCDACLQATCWQGEFYCESYKTAGTVEKTVAELRELGLEHPSWWSEERLARLAG